MHDLLCVCVSVYVLLCACACSSDCESDKEVVNGVERAVIYKCGMPHRSPLCESFLRLLDNKGKKHGLALGTDPGKGKLVRCSRKGKERRKSMCMQFGSFLTISMSRVRLDSYLCMFMCG